MVRFPPRTFLDLLRLIHEDYVSHGRKWDKPGFQALAVHRYGAWVSDRGRIRAAILNPIYKVLYIFVRGVYGIELPAATQVGRRVVIGHQSGIVIHPRSVIGDGCVIRQNVTIGAVSEARKGEAPRLGARVELGAGAVLIGGITIGDDVRIGPNAVVTRNIPAGATVVAPAVRIVLPPAAAARDGAGSLPGAAGDAAAVQPDGTLAGSEDRDQT